MGASACVWRRALIAFNAGRVLAWAEDDCQPIDGPGFEQGAGRCQAKGVRTNGLPDEPDGEEFRYRAAVAKNPQKSAAWVQLGQALLARARASEAESSFRSALSLVPGEPAAHLDLGALLYERGAMQEAEHSFREVLQALPMLEEARHNLAVLLQRRLRYHEAMEVLEPLIAGSEEREPADASGQLYRELLDKTGRWSEAEVQLRRDGSAAGAAALGHFLLRRQRLQEAEPSLRAATGRRGAAADLGTTLWMLGRQAEALASWGRALELHSEHGLSPASFLVPVVEGEEAYRRFRAQEAAAFRATLAAEAPAFAASLSAALADLRRLENDPAWLVRWASERTDVCAGSCPYTRLTFDEWQAMAQRPALRAARGGVLLTLGSGLGEDCIFALAFGFSRCLLFDILCESMVASAKEIAERHGYAERMEYRCADVKLGTQRHESFGEASLVRIPQGPACDLDCRRSLHRRLSLEMAPGALLASASLPLADGLQVVDKFVVKHQYEEYPSEVFILQKSA